MSSRLVLALLLLTPSTLAQLTEKQAISQAKAAGKVQVSLFKQIGKTALAGLDANLDNLEAALDESSAVGTVALNAGVSAIEFVVDMNDAYRDAVLQMAAAESTALVEFADGEDLHGVYPEAFYTGTGGLMDAHRKSLLKAATKLRDSANKRLAQFAKKAEDLAGIAVIGRVELPTAKVASALNQPGYNEVGEGLRLDCVLAASALDTAIDGIMVVGGASGDTASDATVTWFREQAETEAALVSVSDDGRWSALFSALKEGNYVVGAEQGALVATDLTEIGLR